MVGLYHSYYSNSSQALLHFVFSTWPVVLRAFPAAKMVHPTECLHWNWLEQAKGLLKIQAGKNYRRHIDAAYNCVVAHEIFTSMKR